MSTIYMLVIAYFISLTLTIIISFFFDFDLDDFPQIFITFIFVITIIHAYLIGSNFENNSNVSTIIKEDETVKIIQITDGKETWKIARFKNGKDVVLSSEKIITKNRGLKWRLEKALYQIRAVVVS